MSAEAKTLQQLLGPAGEGLEAALADLPAARRSEPRMVAELRRRWAPELVALALRLQEAKDRQGRKFPVYEPLRFTSELLEQASAHPPAAWRARRLAPFGPILDLGCGAGGDLTRLAAAGAEVIGQEADPLGAELARANLAALDLDGGVLTGAYPELATPPHAALFVDPARRARGPRGGRTRRPAEFSPAPAEVAALLRGATAWALKWGPALDLDHAALSGASGPLAGMGRSDYELELVSWNGELREALFWGGEARRGQALKATALKGPPERFGVAEYRGEPAGAAPAPARPEGWIHEPDPALIRSGLLDAFAAELGLAPVAPGIAYLAGSPAVTSPFLRSWRLLEDRPFSLSSLRASLRTLDAGPLVLKKRGFPQDPETLRKRLQADGIRPLTVLIYRDGTGHRFSIAEDPPSGPEA